MEIECINFHPINVGNFLGFADIFIKNLGIEIFGCTVYKKEDRRWVNLPTRSYKTKEGEEKFSQIIRFKEQQVYRDFCTKAKIAIDAFIQIGGGNVD